MDIAKKSKKKQSPVHVRDGVPRRARPGRSVADMMPEFAKDWDYERNGDATPDIVPWASNRRAFWKCHRCGRRDECAVNGKTHTYKKHGPNSGCRSCSSLKRVEPGPGKSMRDRCPVDVVESFLAANAPATPDNVSYGSKRKFLWRCLQDSAHPDYRMSLPSMITTGCPVCKSLLTTHPFLAAEWHPTENGLRGPADVTHGSGIRVWWLGSCGHEWKAAVSVRTSQGTGCPRCFSKRSKMEVGLWAELDAALGPALGHGAVGHHDRLDGISFRTKTVDVVVRTGTRIIAIKYDGAFWHGNPESRRRDARKSEAIRAAGCQLIRVREAPLNKLHDDDVAANGQGARELAGTVLERMLERGWLDPHVSAAAQTYLDIGVAQGTAAAVRALRDVHHVDLGDRSLAVTHPGLAAEWDHRANGTLGPENVTADRSTDVSWTCALGDAYSATPSDRARGRGCPYCAGKLVNARNCLATTHPDLALEYSDANSLTARQIIGGSHLAVEWRCRRRECGHTWTAQVKQRTRTGSRCPACAGRVATATRNLATERPDVAAIWHPTKNMELVPRSVTPGSNQSVWWKCPGCGAEFMGTVVDRCSAAHQLCRSCARYEGRRSRKAQWPKDDS